MPKGSERDPLAGWARSRVACYLSDYKAHSYLLVDDDDEKLVMSHKRARELGGRQRNFRAHYTTGNRQLGDVSKLRKAI